MADNHYGHIAHKASSPTLSTFAPSKILPATISSPIDPNFAFANVPHKDSAHDFGSGASDDEVFENERHDSRARKHLSMDNLSAYDLAAPPPRISHENAELVADRLFSADHLHVILKDPILLQRFTGFLNRYKPHSVPTLVRYLESQKALTAIRYANTLADQISLHSRRSSAAVKDTKFENFARGAIEELVSEALPAYITYRMVNLVTDCLVKEITGNNTPLMKELIQGLAEVYCLSDPSLPDNPIVFASEEFYNTTQYGQEYAIGKNCRFLQGPRTQQPAVKRISVALHNGVEICEILLNYRRDGSPFLNLVMMAPLMDHRGTVRYFIGCQIDISHLLEGGKGLESFKYLLDRDKEAVQKPLPDPLDNRPPLKVLRELGSLLNDEEIEVVHSHNRRGSIDSGRSSTPTRANNPPATARRYVGMDEPIGEPNFWPPSAFGPSGRLPGVYQNYLLVRPYPSLRIIFTSAALRIPGLSQSRLMERIGGPQHVRDGVLDALAQGVGVTAKISWLTQSSHRTNGNRNGRSQSLSQTTSGSSTAEPYAGPEDLDSLEGKPRWIHCTPLLGSDSKPGVIMVVMVDREEITGTLNSHAALNGSPARSRTVLRTRDSERDGWPLRQLQNGGAAQAKFTSAKLYADYLKREGRSASRASERSGEVGPGAPTAAHGADFGTPDSNSNRVTRSRSQNPSVRRGYGHGNGNEIGNGAFNGLARDA